MTEHPLTTKSESDPFAVLGVPPTASDDDVRARYLELVRQYSPESEPEKFQQIHRAYQAASDPLLVARRLIRATPEIETWQSVLDQQEMDPPRIPVQVLLSLGNRQVESEKPTDEE
jgi:hypothetical protein